MQLAYHQAEVTVPEGRYVYYKDDYSVDFEQASGHDVPHKASGLSVCFSHIEVHVSAIDGRLMTAFGYVPIDACNRQPLSPPVCFRGIVKVQEYGEMKCGVSYSLVNRHADKVFFDGDSGWLCLGRPDETGDVSSIEFASDSLLTFKAERPVSLWIRISHFE